MLYNRRLWLQQSLTALAGLTISSNVAAIPKFPYVPSTDVILLNSNENPYGPSPMAQKAILEYYTKSNRYPDDYLGLLLKKIAAHWGVSAENILLGAGSSEIIGLAALHVSKKKKKVITAEPGYKVWNGQAASFGLEFERIPLTPERKTNLPAMLTAIDDTTAMVYICNPNNPTGTFVEVNQLKNFAVEAAKKTLVFIDEAYTLAMKGESNESDFGNRHPPRYRRLPLGDAPSSEGAPGYAGEVALPEGHDRLDRVPPGALRLCA